MQIDLTGVATPPKATHRLFFSIRPDEPTARRIHDMSDGLRRDERLRGRPIGADRLHLTLLFFGDFAGLPAPLIEAAVAAAATVAARPFEVAFDRVASFAGLGRRPIVLLGGERLAALADFRETLREAVAARSLPYEAGRWTPHVTLLYDDRPIEPRPIEPIGWKVDEFVLTASLIGRGPHEALGRWPLR